MGFRSAMFCWGWPWSQGAQARAPGNRTVDSGHCGDSGHSGRPAASWQQVWDDATVALHNRPLQVRKPHPQRPETETRDQATQQDAAGFELARERTMRRKWLMINLDSLSSFWEADTHPNRQGGCTRHRKVRAARREDTFRNHLTMCHHHHHHQQRKGKNPRSGARKRVPLALVLAWVLGGDLQLLALACCCIAPVMLSGQYVTKPADGEAGDVSQQGRRALRSGGDESNNERAFT